MTGDRNNPAQTPQETCAVPAENRHDPRQKTAQSAPDSGALDTVIMPLNWQKPTDAAAHEGFNECDLIATGLGGHYGIQKSGSDCMLWRADDPFAFDTFPTVEAAQVHAEADWQASISRMLATPPAVDPGADAMRPAVLAFARLMEQQLQANDWKGGWQNDPAIALLRRLREETDELSREIEAAGDRVWRDWDPAAHSASALSHRQVIVSFVPGRGWFCADIHTPKRFNPDVDAKRRIGEEAADVANFAMMVADVSGSLGPDQKSEPTE